MQLSRFVPFVAALLMLGACSETSATTDDAALAPDAGSAPAGDAGAGVPSTLGPSERPARLVVPTAHDGTTPLPLVFLLHGYGASGTLQDTYFMASATARTRGFYLVVPDGTMDASDRRFWNATPFCCDFAPTAVDDVAYLTGLLDEAIERLPVDEDRVYFIGHSNGGFMSYRMACEISDRVAAIMSLAGSDYAGEMDCVPSADVSVLQVHGTMDDTILYAGTAGYPSARDAVVRWAERAGCAETAVMGTALDVDVSLEGAETQVETWSAGCTSGRDYALWTIENGGHIPSFNRMWMPAVADWILAHRR